MKTAASLLIAVLCFCFAGSGVVSANAPSELTILHTIPRAVLDRVSFDAAPDANGDMQLNRGHWTSVVFQRVAMPLFWVGAAESNQTKVDQAWLATTEAFKHQLPDGSFATANGSAMQSTDMAFWIEAVTHGILVLNESSLASQNAQRVSSVLPKIAAATAWLQQPAHLQALLNGDKLGTNRVFTDANAFAGSGLLLHNASFLGTARDIESIALGRQQPDGVFPEQGGFDSSYQAVSLLHASYLQLRISSNELETAIGRGLTRELRAIGPDGTVSVAENTRTGRNQEQVYGHPKPVDQRSVILGLYYSGILLGREDGVKAADAVYRNLH